ncbi:MAG TPA: MFS transporter [Anaerolineales bacterium]|nr:MFS transporter [Anaerolineales bacterium]
MQSVKKVQRTYHLIISLFWLATALPISLSILLIKARGLNLIQVGLAMGIYSLTIVLLEVPTGGLADTIGRKRVAIAAYITTLIAQITLLFAFSFPAFLAGFILSGVGRALSSGALDAWFVDALKAADPDVDLQPAFAKVGTFTLLSLGIGTLGGSLIPGFFTQLPADGTAVLTPLSMPVAFSILIQITLLLAAAFLIEEERPSSGENSWLEGIQEIPSMIKTATTLIQKSPILLLLLGVSSASGFVLLSLESFWQPHFAGLMGGSEGNTFWFGVIMGGNFLMGMVGNMIVTPVSKALGKRYALVAAIFQGLTGIVLIGLALQSNVYAGGLLFWLVYMSMGAGNSPYNTLLNEQIPSGQRSSMLSIASLASYVGGTLGGLLLGFVAEYASIPVAWLIAGGVLVLSLMLYLRIEILQQKEMEIGLDGQEKPILETR